MTSVSRDRFVQAVRSQERIAGYTHNFYRYPARFSPVFARAAIVAFSKPGNVVLDPYMGGGTTIVEAMALGRRAIGCDLNSLAGFVTRVKTTLLNADQVDDVRRWTARAAAAMSFRTNRESLKHVLDDEKTKNLTLASARPTKKATAAAMAELAHVTTEEAKDFARCVLLKTAQWALDGRTKAPTLEEVRRRLREFAGEMLGGLDEFREACVARARAGVKPELIEANSAVLHQQGVFATRGVRADLVVTSPPYPGVHMLYHRWQVNGRRETPAPYWIAGCNDGQGESYYNFGSRRGAGLTNYYESSLRTLQSLRHVVRDGGLVVQMIAFSEPAEQLRRYLDNMSAAGFAEVRMPSLGTRRLWRDVPGRKWHANSKGSLPSAREVVLVHKAV